MRPFPSLFSLVLAGLFLPLAACGGGGSGGFDPVPPAPVQTASLDGQVLEVDGQTTALAGVSLSLVETGQVAVSGADGAFAFGDVPTGTLTLALVSPTTSTYVVLANGSDDDLSGDDDVAGDDDLDDEEEIEDGEDLDDSGEVEVHRARERERIRVRLRIRDGVIAEMDCSRDGDGEREVEIRMIRTDDSDDADIEGKLELESRGLRDKFEVEVEDATPDRLLELVVIDPDGVEASLGTRVVDAFGEAEWELETNDGDVLPFGVDDVESLEGYGVEVRDGDTALVLLTVDVPELPPVMQRTGDDDSDDDSDDGDDDSGNGDDALRQRSRVRLRAQVAGLEGHVELRSRPEEGEERFEMEAEHLGAGRSVDFEIETGEGTGQFSRIRTMTANAGGEAELEINTRHGDTLPNDAQGVRELVRLRVQVRDSDTGDVLLDGTLPELVTER